MKGNRLKRVLGLVLLAALAFALLGFVVMGLWNWLLPTLFGLHPITFWQAVGVVILSRILFGGFRGRRGRHWYWRRRMMKRWERMSPEDREKWRQSFRGRCGSSGSATAQPKA